MRPQKDIAILIMILIAGVLAQVYNCRLIQNQIAVAGKTVVTSAHAGAIPIRQSRTGNVSLRIPLEEEDDDDTGKEMLNSTAIFHSVFLSQLYVRQQSIFAELFLDISSPPPRLQS